MFSAWLEDVVHLWESSVICPNPSIATFVLNLTSLLTKDEFQFNNLNSTNLFLRMCKTLHLTNKIPSNGISLSMETNEPFPIITNEVTSSMKVGYVKMLISFTNHQSGLNWIRLTSCWEDVLSYCLECQNIYISKEAINFIYQLVKNLIHCDKTFCDSVAIKVLTPLNTDYESHDKVAPTIKLLTSVLEQIYMGDEDITLKQLFVRDDLEDKLWLLLNDTKHCELTFDVSKLLFLVSFVVVTLGHYECREAALPQLEIFGRKFSRLFNMLIGNMRFPFTKNI